MARRGETRARMVRSAASVFRERGIAGAALVDIADRGHAPRGSIYHHFPGGKEQLAAEATDEAGRYISRMITKVLPLGPEATVTGLIDYFRTELPTSDFTTGCPVAAGALEFGEAPTARERAGVVFAEWEDRLATGFADHGFVRVEAEELATLIVTSIEGALVLARAQHSLRPLDRVEAYLLRQIREAT